MKYKIEVFDSRNNHEYVIHYIAINSYTTNVIYGHYYSDMNAFYPRKDLCTETQYRYLRNSKSFLKRIKAAILNYEMLYK